MKAIEKLLNSVNLENYSFNQEFNNIILNHATNYDGNAKNKLKSFLEDLQHGGCISGLIGEFAYHSNCKEFYINHIEDLEDFKTELDNQIGEPIKNRDKIVHYTFIVWLVFEEYCHNIYNQLFD